MPGFALVATNLSFELAPRRGQENTFVKCLLDWFRVPTSSAATGLGSEGRRGDSGDVPAGQLDVQVTSDIDLDELGQPHIVR